MVKDLPMADMPQFYWWGVNNPIHCPCENQPQSPLQPPGLDRANKPSNQNPAFMTSKVSGSNWTLYRWSQRGRANTRLRFVASNLWDVFVQTFLGLENKTIMTFSLLRTNWPEAHCCYKTLVKWNFSHYWIVMPFKSQGRSLALFFFFFFSESKPASQPILCVWLTTQMHLNAFTPHVPLLPDCQPCSPLLNKPI